MVDRSMRVILSANTGPFVTGMRTGEEAIRSFARQGKEAKIPYEQLIVVLDKVSTAARKVGLAGNELGTGFRESSGDIRHAADALLDLSIAGGQDMDHAVRNLKELRTVVTGLSASGGAAADLTRIANSLLEMSTTGGLDMDKAITNLEKLRAILPRLAGTGGAASDLARIAAALHELSAVPLTGKATELDELAVAMRKLLRVVKEPAPANLREIAKAIDALGLTRIDLAPQIAELAKLRRELNDLRANMARPLPAVRGGAIGGAAGAVGAVGRSDHGNASILGGGLIGSFLKYQVGYAAITSVGVAMGATLKQTATFETALNVLGEITKTKATPQLAAAGKEAIALGADLSIANASATDAATTMQDLVKGGLSMSDAMLAAKGSMQLASAGSISFTAAATDMSRTLQQFNLNGSHAGEVANELANVSTLAGGGITGFTEALKYAGTNASVMGWSLQQTLGVLALYAKGGQTGSLGGTGLKDLIARLVSADGKSTAAGKALKTLGINVYDSNGKFLSAAKLTDDLTKAHTKLAPTIYNSAIQTLFGARASVGANLLAVKGAAVLSTLTKEVHDNAGVAAISKAKTEGLTGAFLDLQNQAQTAAVIVGTKFSAGISTAVRSVSAAIVPIANFLTGATFASAISKTGNFFEPLIQGASHLISVAWPYIKNFASSIGSAFGSIVDYIRPVVAGVGSFFKGFADGGTLKFFGSALDGLGKGFANILKFLAPVGKAVGAVYSWFGKLPEPILAGATALGIFLLLKGPLTSMLTSVVTKVDAVGQSFFRTFSTGALSSVRAFGSGLLGAFGGPVGLAITVVTTALAFFLTQSHDATVATRDFSGAIDENTGKLAKNAAQVISSAAGDTIDKYVKLGGAVGDYTLALEGNKDAQGRVVSTLDSTASKLIGGSKGWAALSDSAKRAGLSQADVAAAFVQGGDAQANVVKKLGLGMVTLNGVMQPAAIALNLLGRDVSGQHDIYTQYESDLGSVNDSVRKGAAAANDNAGAASAMGSVYAHLPSIVKYGQDMDKANRLTATSGGAAAKAIAGVAASATDATAPAVASGAAITGALKSVSDAATFASDQVSLFKTNMDLLNGVDLTVAESQRAAGTAIRDIGKNYRDQATAAQALVDARAKLKTDTANLGKTNADGTPATDATTQANVDADARAIVQAQSDITAALDATTAARESSRTSIETEAITTGKQVTAQKGYAAGLAATIAVYQQRHDQFVQEIVDNRAVGVSAAAARALALKQATALGLDPNVGKITIAFDTVIPGAAVARVAKLKKIADDASAAKTLKFTTATKDALLDIKTFGADIAHIPPIYKTSFKADVAAAKTDGYNLYQVYDKTTGQWTARFLQPTYAETMVKAGNVVRQYDATKGTWTANLIAKDLASAAVQKLALGLAGIKDKQVKLIVTAGGGVMQIAPDGSFVNKSATGAIVGRGKAAGGPIHGPGHGKSDDVPIWGSDGEFMHTAKDYKRNKRAVEYIHRGGTIKGFAEGGAIGGANLIVNASETGNIQKALDEVTLLTNNAVKSAAAFNAAGAVFTGASGLMGSQDPSAWGWTVGKNIVPYSFGGVDFAGGIAAGTAGIWNAFLAQLVPTIPGGLRAGEDWGFENRDNVNSPGRKSFHAYGLALDANAPENGNGTQPGTGPGQIPLSAGPLAARYNILWGGSWADPMHFELHDTPAQVASGGASAGVGASAGGGSGVAPSASSAGVEQWRALATSVFAAKGVPLMYVQTLLNQMNQESGGNPAAINLTDANAKAGHPSVGLLQFIPSTFASYGDYGYLNNIYDPASQFHAFINYINARYGGMAAFTAKQQANGWGAYANGGYVSGPGGPRSDAIRADLSNGEFVVNANSTARHLGLLHAINGYAAGGLVVPSAQNLVGIAGLAPAGAGPLLTEVIAAVAAIALQVAKQDNTLVVAKSAAQKAIAAADAAAVNATVVQKKTAAAFTVAQLKAGATANARIMSAQTSLDRVQRTAAASELAAQQRLQAAHDGRTKNHNAIVLAAQQHLAAVQLANTSNVSAAEKKLGDVRKAATSKASVSQAALIAANTKAAATADKARIAQANYQAVLGRTAAIDKVQAAYQRQYHTQEVLAGKLDALNAKQITAQDNLATLTATRASAAASIASSVTGFDGGITGHPDTRNTFETILIGQQYDAAKAREFNAELTKLKKTGLNATTLNTIASAGIDGGGVAAHALAQATPAQIKQLNAVTAQLAKYGAGAGSTAAGVMYDAGIATAQGVVKGILSQENAIKAAMLKIAKSIVSTFKGALKISSPSQVFHSFGGNTVQGFANGVTAGTHKAHAALGGMVSMPTIPPHSYSNGGGAMSIAVYLDGQRIDDKVEVRINGAMVQLDQALRKRAAQPA